MKKPIIFIIALLFYFTFGFSEDYAILVGINQYQYLSKLKYAENDAIDMTELLQNLGFQTQTLVNGGATRENILNCLVETVQKTGEDDLIMFFFSGHGFAGADLSKRGVFPVDTDMKEVFPISQEEIVEMMSQTNGNKVLFLDACYQGSRTKNLKREILKPKVNIQEYVDNYDLDLFIAASASNQLALDGIYIDGNEIKNGIATYLFIEGIKTGAIDENEDNAFTNGEIARYFEFFANRIPDSVDQKPEAAFSISRAFFSSRNQELERQTTQEEAPSTQTQFVMEEYDNDTYNTDVSLLIEEISSNRDDDLEKTVMFGIKEKLMGRRGVSILTRNDKEMETIVEERKISSMNPTLKEEEIIKAAEFYIKGNLSELADVGVVQLRLNLVNLNSSRETLFRTFDYGYMRDGKLIKNFQFEDEIEDYLNEVIMYVRSPIESFYKDKKLQLEIENESVVKANDEIIFRIFNDFDYLYLFTSTPEGDLEYLTSTKALGLLELTAVASIDGTKDAISEYLIVLGTETGLSEGTLGGCQDIDTLQTVIDNTLKNSEFAFTFVNYVIRRR